MEKTQGRGALASMPNKRKLGKKKVQVHLEQVKKHEHNLEQQKMMLAESLEVKALWALVAETTSGGC